MRKLVFALAMTLCLLSTFTIGASAHTVQQVYTVQSIQKFLITPHVSGGGCSGYRINDTKDISVEACISYAYPYLEPDRYVSFLQRTGHGGVSSCTVKIVVYRTSGSLVDNSYVQNCAVQASRNTFGAHFGPDSIFDLATNTSYYCYLIVKLLYTDTIASSALSPDSPTISF